MSLLIGRADDEQADGDPLNLVDAPSAHEVLDPFALGNFPQTRTGHPEFSADLGAVEVAVLVGNEPAWSGHDA